jgi:hypothetical protein
VESQRPADAWFPDAGDNATHRLHAPFLRALRSVLDELRPLQLRPSDTVTTGEGPEVCIAIMPHVALGGISLVGWSDERHVGLEWASVTDLSYHDEIDLGVQVARVLRDQPQWEEEFRHLLTAELRRPLSVRSRRVAGQLRVAVSIDVDRKAKLVGRVRVGRWRPLPLRRDGREETTSLTASQPLSLSIPPPVGHLRLQA